MLLFVTLKGYYSLQGPISLQTWCSFRPVIPADLSENEFQESESELSELSGSDEDNNESMIPVLNEEIGVILNRVRKIVKFFKLSPTKNSILQQYVTKKTNKEMSLLIDCRTRWNTIEIMIERFLKIKDCVNNALKTLNLTNHIIDEQGIRSLKNLLNILKPIKLAVEALSRRDTNLIMSEGIFKFLLETLKENKSNIAERMLSAIILRIKERRNENLISLIQFLQNPELLKENVEFEVLKLSTKNEIIKTAKKINDRLFCNSVIIDEDAEDVQIINTPETTSLSEKLQLKINSMQQTMQINADNINKSFTREVNMYNKSGQFTHNLKQLRESLNTIRPTSTESERIFSIAGNFVTKKRSSLRDDSLNALCFLKSHFNSNVD